MWNAIDYIVILETLARGAWRSLDRRWRHWRRHWNIRDVTHSHTRRFWFDIIIHVWFCIVIKLHYITHYFRLTYCGRRLLPRDTWRPWRPVSTCSYRCSGGRSSSRRRRLAHLCKSIVNTSHMHEKYVSRQDTGRSVYRINTDLEQSPRSHGGHNCMSLQWTQTWAVDRSMYSEHARTTNLLWAYFFERVELTLPIGSVTLSVFWLDRPALLGKIGPMCMTSQPCCLNTSVCFLKRHGECLN